MIDIEVAAGRVATDLDRLHLGHALIGGLAVSARTLPRFTKDLDRAIAVADDGEAESAVHELVKLGYEIRGTVEHETAGRFATVRLVTPGVTFSADLLSAAHAAADPGVGRPDPAAGSREVPGGQASVIAPRSAPDARRAYLASTPEV